MVMVFGLHFILLIALPILSNKYILLSFLTFGMQLSNLNYFIWTSLTDDTSKLKSVISNVFISTILFSLIHSWVYSNASQTSQRLT